MELFDVFFISKSLQYVCMTQTVKSANWHITNRCNYACKFCFAQNLGKKELSLKEGTRLLQKLAAAGIEKINFAGGEPLLHPHLVDYCQEAKRLGMTVSIVTNGSKLDQTMIESLKGCVDWIGLSIDSALETVEQKLRRGYGQHVENIINAAYLIRKAGIHLKINTTVTSLTWQENMLPLIRLLRPDRWKVMQMMTITGENDDSGKGLEISNGEFRAFIERHRSIVLDNGTYPVFEYADDMESSYFMITPDGHVKTDTGKKITLHNLDTVLSNGIDSIMSDEKYLERGGIYAWKDSNKKINIISG